jgi:hypothetical protein
LKLSCRGGKDRAWLKKLNTANKNSVQENKKKEEVVEEGDKKRVRTPRSPTDKLIALPLDQAVHCDNHVQYIL